MSQNAFQGDFTDTFVAKFNPTASGAASLIYITVSGGTTAQSYDQGIAVAVDSSGAIYMAGITNATDFPTTASARQGAAGGGGAGRARRHVPAHHPVRLRRPQPTHRRARARQHDQQFQLHRRPGRSSRRRREHLRRRQPGQRLDV
jgi:hypothetical protein